VTSQTHTARAHGESSTSPPEQLDLPTEDNTTRTVIHLLGTWEPIAAYGLLYVNDLAVQKFRKNKNNAD